MQDKKFIVPRGIHQNVIKHLLNEFFTELVPKFKGGNPVTTMGVWPDGKKRPNQHYEREAINTKNQAELDEFVDKKLLEYLNPGPIYKEGEKAPSLYLSEISKANAINKDLRTPEMFFEFEIDKAREYQNYFPDYAINDQHLKYWSPLNDWIKYLESRLSKLNALQGAIEKLNSIERVSDKMEYYCEFTGQTFENFKETVSRKIGNKDYELSVKFTRTEELTERGKWFINKFKNSWFEQKKAEYEGRLDKCDNPTEKKDVSYEILQSIKKQVKDTNSLTYDGYKSQKEKEDPLLRRESFPDLWKICHGVVLHKFEAYIKERIANGFAPENKLKPGFNRIKQGTTDKVYTDFDELFIDEMKARPDLIDQCYQPLSNLGITNENHEFILPPKGNICVWYQALKGKHLLKPILKNEDNIVTPLLNKKFPGVELYLGAATEHHKKAEINFRVKFNKTLPELPKCK